MLPQDRESYIVAEGQSVVGSVAVWRSPVVMPTDIEVWTALPWPNSCWAIPNKCVVCSSTGAGVTNLAGGDYDGDTIVSPPPGLGLHPQSPMRQLPLNSSPRPKTALPVQPESMNPGTTRPKNMGVTAHAFRTWHRVRQL